MLNPYQKDITKTIVRGMREVKQLVGIRNNSYGFPILDYATKYFESNKILQEFDGELLANSKYIYIKIDDEFKKVNWKSTNSDCEILTVIVDELIKEENIEQKFNHDEIMELYSEKVNKYWEEFLEKYKDDYAKSALIKMYHDNGMNLEDIVEIIENEQSPKFVGIPTAPTANSSHGTQIASNAYVTYTINSNGRINF